jgi:hypothetical protein
MKPAKLMLVASGSSGASPSGLPSASAWARRPAVSNTERQRQFRQRNPGYYGRLKAKQRAASKAWVKERLAIAQGVAEILCAYLKTPLMLPAPVDTIELPGITTIRRLDPISIPLRAEPLLRDAA